MISVEQKRVSKEEIVRTLWLIAFFRPGIESHQLVRQAEINHPGQNMDIREVFWAMAAVDKLHIQEGWKVYVDKPD